MSFTAAAGLVAWAAVLLVSHLVGRVLRGNGMKLFAPPLFGHFDLRLGRSIVPATIFACMVVFGGRRASHELSWWAVLVATGVSAFAWAVLLAYAEGWDALSAPLRSPHDYLATASGVGSPSQWLSTFTARLSSYGVHVQGHPPGMVLALWIMQRAGIGVFAIALVIVAAGASAASAALVALRNLSGEVAARRAAPFMVLAPAAVWIATSDDALWLGTSAWGIAALTVAAARRDAKGHVAALVGGGLLGGSLFLSYGVVPLGAVVVSVGLYRRRWLPLVSAGVAVVAVGVLFWSFGFSWFDGLAATAERYAAGVSRHRPFAYFALANLAAFSIALGPATAVALAQLRRRSTWVLVGAALVAVMIADLSGFSKGEVERIWLPFVPWVLMSTSTLDGAPARGLLGLQALTGLAVQVGTRTPW
ncbi:MAG: hypothetical protein ABR529_16105 [Actinomycetota bacterium]